MDIIVISVILAHYNVISEKILDRQKLDIMLNKFCHMFLCYVRNLFPVYILLESAKTTKTYECGRQSEDD